MPEAPPETVLEGVAQPLGDKEGDTLTLGVVVALGEPQGEAPPLREGSEAVAEELPHPVGVVEGERVPQLEAEEQALALRVRVTEAVKLPLPEDVSEVEGEAERLSVRVP